MFSLCDCHCDTITTIIDNGEELYKNSGHIDIERLSKFRTPLQVFAVWLDEKRRANPYINTVRAIEFYYQQIEKNSEYITHVNTYDEIAKNIKRNKISGMLSVEGAEAIEGNIDNVYKLYELGVRFMGLTWNNENEVGYGVNHSDNGLKQLGIQLVKESPIVIDVSHINERGFWDCYNYCNKPIIASHSNAYDICNNKRNLKHEQLKAISERSGIVGLNLHVPFLDSCGRRDVSIEYIIRHIDYMLEVVGEDCICLGCDFDGTKYLGWDTRDVVDMNVVGKWIDVVFGKEVAKKIMYKNYREFVRRVY